MFLLTKRNLDWNSLDNCQANQDGLQERKQRDMLSVNEKVPPPQPTPTPSNPKINPELISCFGLGPVDCQRTCLGWVSLHAL